MVRGAEIRRLRDLELLIQGIPSYTAPKLELEQYVTDANIVAVAVWDAYMRNDLNNATALDLGCGTGRFSIAAAIMGAKHVVCVDVDLDAVSIAKAVSGKFELQNVDFVVMDARRVGLRGRYGVVFQNPPFGIWSGKGLDIEFLKTATNYSDTIYTIHKLTTLNYVEEKVREWGCTMNILDKVTIAIPPMYKHHRKRLHKVEVFLARIECKQGHNDLVKLKTPQFKH
jgi:methyltransferase (EC 2.1.1.-)